MRPAILFEGVVSPLAGRRSGEIDMVVVRENTEGEYAQIGGVLYQEQPEEIAVQTSVFTRRGCERVIRHAFELARRRGGGKRVASITKSNAQGYSMAPVASNLSGDILSDLSAMVRGSIETVHGTAPGIFGKGIANPLARILPGVHDARLLGHPEAAESVHRAIAARAGRRTLPNARSGRRSHDGSGIRGRDCRTFFQSLSSTTDKAAMGGSGAA